MKTEILKFARLERYIFGIILAILMVFVAELSHEKEIIFPEICALTIGAWVSELQPWVVNKRRIFILMSLASIFGVLIVRYFPCPLIFQVCLCFIFCGVILTLFKTNFVPIISACILPVYLKTTSFIYPVSVIIMALIIIFAQWLMEKFHLRPHIEFKPVEFKIKNEIIKWSKLLLIFGLVSIIPFKFHQIYFLAPPLIVMFTELSNPKSKARKKPLYIAALMAFGAFTGCLIRLVFNVYFNIPLYFCTALACIILFFALNKVKINFPPAGAILLIPMILDESLLKIFPFEVLIGALILSFLALIMFKEEKIKPLKV